MLNISEKGSQTPYTTGYRTRKEIKSHGVKKSNKKRKKIQGHDGKREERQTGLRTRVKKAGIERKGAKETFGESASHHKGGSR